MQAWTGAGALPARTAANSKNRARASFLSFKGVPFRAMKDSGLKERGVSLAPKRAVGAKTGNHIGFYPAPRGIEELEEEIAAYEGAKSSLRFPLDKPVPYDLIRKIVKLRAKTSPTAAALC